MTGKPKIRRRLSAGDLGAIVALHGVAYAREHRLDATFEAHVCSAVAVAARRGWPGEREAVWIVESGGAVVGSLALTDEGSDRAALRWFLLDERLRGCGLGRRLVGELLARARSAGFHSVGLETFSELRAAASLYREHQFELVGSETGSRWGREELTYQRYELRLASRCVGGAGAGGPRRGRSA